LGSDGVYRCDGFQQFIWQEHGFGTIQGSPSVDVTLRQIHSNRVLMADHLADREEEGDALLTDVAQKSVGVRTADCVPILLLDARKRAVGAVHAGWRGSADGIVGHAIAKLHEWFRTSPADVHVAIGPCIRECCYEVGSEVAARFSSQFPDWKAEEQGRRKLDLVRANVEQIRSARVPEAQIFDSGLCTACEAAVFYSYRREPENPGRLLSAISRLA
jgi:YfiH family protein